MGLVAVRLFCQAGAAGQHAQRQKTKRQNTLASSLPSGFGLGDDIRRIRGKLGVEAFGAKAIPLARVATAQVLSNAIGSKGFIKMQSFRKSQNKLAYAYLLTPFGITEKAGLTVRFLERKVAEYESLTHEIEALRSEIDMAQSKSGSIHD